MAEDSKEKNHPIPRGYTPNDTKDRIKWVKDKTGIDFGKTKTDKPEELQ